MKQCIRCGEERELSDYKKMESGNLGNVCRICRNQSCQESKQRRRKGMAIPYKRKFTEKKPVEIINKANEVLRNWGNIWL